MAHEKQKQQRLLEEIEMKRRQLCRRMEEIEKLKFKQDVHTGLTYFDMVKQMIREGEREV